MLFQKFKGILKKAPIYPFLRKIKLEREKKKILGEWEKLEREGGMLGKWKKLQMNKNIIIRNWEKKGKPIPPPYLVKREIIKKYAQKFSINILIETGTYLGETAFAMRDTFSQIYSIELDNYLYIKAKERLSDISNVHILKGDSSKILPDLLISIIKPCLSWLDGHYSGVVTAKGDLNTPILEELKHIFNHSIKSHVILVDDARLFTGQKDYPSINDLKKFIAKKRPNWLFEVKDDIIRIHGYN